MRKKIISVSLIIVIIAVVVIIGLVGFDLLNGKNEKQIITSSTLEKIIKVSDLSTYEAVYNGVAKVNNEKKKDEIDYYVSYEAKVKAGIDFEKVKVNVDDKEKKINVILPEIKIYEVNVDITSLDYIFMNDKANTSTVSEEAYEKCIDDVTTESSTEEAIYDIAKQNAKNIIKALINPFVEQLNSKYELVIE